MEEIKETVQEIIKRFDERMKGAEMSRSDLSTMMGVHRNTVEYWFRGVSTPSIETLQKVEVCLVAHENKVAKQLKILKRQASRKPSLTHETTI